MLFQPLDRRAIVHLAEMHHQIDRPATALVEMPVEELGARYRKRTAFGLPPRPVTPITLGAPFGQHRLKRYRADRGGAAAEIVLRHRTLLVERVPQALAVLDVDHVTIFGQSIDQGGGQLFVVQK